MPKTHKARFNKNNKTHKRNGKTTNNMIIQFIKKTFGLQMALKMVHWSTRSYSVHKATDESMEKVMPLIDSFVESFLGKKHYSLKQYALKSVPVHKIKTKDQLNRFIDNNVNYLISLNKYISKEEHSDLVSIRDGIVSELNILKYLLHLEK
jgi:DNA-binding ferritin-like protein